MTRHRGFGFLGALVSAAFAVAACSAESAPVSEESAGDVASALIPVHGGGGGGGGGTSVCTNACKAGTCSTVKVGTTTCHCNGPCGTGLTCSGGQCLEVLPPFIDGSTLDPDTDRPGFDLSDMTNSNLVSCATACVQNARCDSWAFRTSDAHCWLKYAVPGTVSVAGEYSGRVTRDHEVDVDRDGNDYAEIDVTSPQDCQTACEGEAQCVAYSSHAGHCWLKNGLGSLKDDTGDYTGFKGMGSHALAFRNADARLDTSTGDWKPASHKAECGKGAVVGISKDVAYSTAHAILCSDDFAPRYPHTGCTTLDFTNGDNRRTTSTGDWDQNFPKAECGVNEYVAGVSQRPDGFVDSILCCPGKVDHSSCAPLYNYAGDVRQTTATSNWDDGFVKLECGSGKYVAGVARNSRPGQAGGPDAVLCCSQPDLPRPPPPRKPLSIASYTVAPDYINPGDPSTISWSANVPPDCGTLTGAIVGQEIPSNRVVFSQTVHGASGSITVTPKDEWTNYTLTLHCAIGDTASQSHNVEIYYKQTPPPSQTVYCFKVVNQWSGCTVFDQAGADEGSAETTVKNGNPSALSVTNIDCTQQTSACPDQNL